MSFHLERESITSRVTSHAPQTQKLQGLQQKGHDQNMTKDFCHQFGKAVLRSLKLNM